MHRKSSGFCSRCKRKLNMARKESFYTMPLTRYVKRAVAMPNEAWRTLWIVPLAALVFALSCVGAALDEEKKKTPAPEKGRAKKVRTYEHSDYKR